MKKRKCNKSMIMLVLLLTTVILSSGLGPINTGPSQINTQKNISPIKSQEPHTAQIIVWENNGSVISNALGEQDIFNYDMRSFCSDGDGGVIMAWNDKRGSDNDIYAQRIASNGKTLFDANGTVICNATGKQIAPSICSDGEGGAIVVWYDNRTGTGDDFEIYAQRIHSNGTTLWKPNGTVVCNATTTQNYMHICFGENESAIIVWADTRTSNYDIYAQKIDEDGIPMWRENGTVICNETNTQFLSSICSDGEGGAFIAWYENRIGTDDIYAQRINLNGETQWTKNGTVICNSTFNDRGPIICDLGNGDAIIAWLEGSYDGLYAQIVASDGKTLWKDNGTVICDTAGAITFPQLCSDGAGGAIITWSDYRNGGVSGYDIYAQRISSGEDFLWETNGTLICNVDGNQYGYICSDGAGGAIITWIDDRLGTDDIYAQMISSRGRTLWKANGTLICNAEDQQRYPRICSDGAGGAIIMWKDNRNGLVSDWDIYAQRIKPSPAGIYALADDDDDDDEEELNILLIVLIIVLVSVGALTIIIVVLIKKEVIQIPKSLQRKNT